MRLIRWSDVWWRLNAWKKTQTAPSSIPFHLYPTSSMTSESEKTVAEIAAQ